MKLISSQKVDFEFHDDRGSLIQLVHEGYKQINVLFSKQGVFRGGHYHKNTTECFFVVSGKVEIEAKYNGLKEKNIFIKGDFFKVSPCIVHSMHFLEDCTMVQMYDQCVENEDGAKDIIAERL